MDLCIRFPSAALLLLLLLVGCSSGEAASSTTTAPHPVGETSAGGPGAQEAQEAQEPQEAQAGPVFFTAEGAPPPLACSDDADCVAAGALDSAGCCWSYRDANLVAMSTAYRAWQTAHQAASCAGVTCPPPPVPAQPPRCLMDVSCADAVCQNACNR